MQNFLAICGRIIGFGLLAMLGIIFLSSLATAANFSLSSIIIGIILVIGYTLTIVDMIWVFRNREMLRAKAEKARG